MKWVLLNGINVENIIVPGNDDFKIYLENLGKIVHIVEDDVPVAPFWIYDVEENAYYE